MGDSPDETAFLRSNISRLLRSAGFIDIKVSPFDWLHPATPPKLINLINKTGAFLEKIPVIREFAGSLHIFSRHPE
jgi:hypothetical protein